MTVAGALATDVRTHLADRPIAARPPTRAYLLSRFARRHRGLVATLAALVLGLTASVLLFLDAEGARRSERAQREEAERQGAIAASVLGPMLDTFERANPDVHPQGREMTASELLELAGSRTTEPPPNPCCSRR